MHVLIILLAVWAVDRQGRLGVFRVEGVTIPATDIQVMADAPSISRKKSHTPLDHISAKM